MAGVVARPIQAGILTLLGLTSSLVGLVAPSPTWAGEHTALNRAIATFERGASTQAEPLLRSALKVLRSPAARAKAWLYLGLCRATGKDLDGARSSFAHALSEDPGITPNPARTAPDIVSLFRWVRQRTVGRLRVESTEPSTRIFVDGRDRGLAPLALELPVGWHAVRGITEDQSLASMTYRVLVTQRKLTQVTTRPRRRLGGAFGRTSRYRYGVALRPPRGTLKLAITPPSAGIYLKGRPLKAKHGRFNLPAGRHRLVFRAPSYREAARDVEVRADITTELRLRMSPSTPWYRSRRTWAWISLGLAGASAVAGLAVGSSAQSSERQLRSQEASGILTVDSFLSLGADASSKAQVANILFGVAGASALTSVVLLLLGDKKKLIKEKPPSGVRVVPTARGLALGGNF